MIYKYFQKNNYEDFSSGRFFYHKPKYPNYPVRLAGEIFCRCLEYIDKKNEIVIYDPCCGSGYMLTVLGYLFNEKIKTIYASDILNEAIELARKNLSLLSYAGIEERKNELLDLFGKFAKKSHKDALQSLNNLRKHLKHEIAVNCYTQDILSTNRSKNIKFTADVVMTDVPYGDLTAWSNYHDKQIDILLDVIKPLVTTRSIVSITRNKNQKYNNSSFQRMDSFKIGHRVVDLIKLKEHAKDLVII